MKRELIGWFPRQAMSSLEEEDSWEESYFVIFIVCT